ncbi:ABC transporter permease [Actinomyces sp. Z5]|uniref:ABC transporter permease n=1 Tax=Actinomyces sp. Z5 TaxID=2250216 RepID=UPI000DCECAB5|nr:ABC transporter permease subunit [Actinomyces sp. Z5]RAX24253.1 ABC transporter permease [Actinomyces sp. Z5]
MSRQGIRTVMVLELRQRVRSTRWWVMLLVWALVLIVLFVGMTGLSVSAGMEREEFAPVLYDMVLCFVLGIGLIVAPTLSATSINGDRADATLALLQATALRSREIAVGKLLAAWLAAMAFLAVALPFLLILAAVGGANLPALLGHMLLLVVTLGSVCGIGLGFSALTARTSASAVLTYLVVAALTVGTPMATVLVAPMVQEQQESITYSIDHDASTDDQLVCHEDPYRYHNTVTHTERIWWLLIPNPFVALGDVSTRAPLSHYNSDNFLEGLGRAIDTMRDPQSSEPTVHNPCAEQADDSDDDVYESSRDESGAGHVAFWPASAALLLLLGAGGAWVAARRLRVPAGPLPRGIRLA